MSGARSKSGSNVERSAMLPTMFTLALPPFPRRVESCSGACVAESCEGSAALPSSGVEVQWLTANEKPWPQETELVKHGPTCKFTQIPHVQDIKQGILRDCDEASSKRAQELTGH